MKCQHPDRETLYDCAVEVQGNGTTDGVDVQNEDECIAYASGHQDYPSAVRAIISCEDITKAYVPNSEIDDLYQVVRNESVNPMVICPADYFMTACMATNYISPAYPDYRGQLVKGDPMICKVTNCAYYCHAVAVCVNKKWILNGYAQTEAQGSHSILRTKYEQPIIYADTIEFVMTALQPSNAHCAVYTTEQKAKHFLYETDTGLCVLFTDKPNLL